MNKFVKFVDAQSSTTGGVKTGRAYSTAVTMYPAQSTQGTSTTVSKSAYTVIGTTAASKGQNVYSSARSAKREAYRVLNVATGVRKG